MRHVKNILIFFASVLLGAMLLSYVFNRYSWESVISVMSSVKIVYLLLYLLISAIIMAVFALRWKIILKANGHDVSYWELLSYRTIDYGVSYLTPTGKMAGEPVRAALLMRHGLNFRQGISSITIDKTIEISSTVVFFALGCFVLILSKSLSGGLAVFLAVLCSFLIFLNWLFFYRILRGKTVFIPLLKFLHLDRVNFLKKFLSAVAEAERPIIVFYRDQRSTYFVALALTFFTFFLSMVEFALLLYMFDINPTLSETFMVFSGVGLSFILPIPMGLGVLEVLQGAIFSRLGFPTAAGVGLALITRGRDLMWLVIGVVFAIYYGSLRRVLFEAFNSKYANPVVNMTLFRDGKPGSMKIKMVRESEKNQFISLNDLSRKMRKK